VQQQSSHVLEKGGKKFIQTDKNNSLLRMMGGTTFEFGSASWELDG
jgi:hypothetical protein